MYREVYKGKLTMLIHIVKLASSFGANEYSIIYIFASDDLGMNFASLRYILLPSSSVARKWS